MNQSNLKKLQNLLKEKDIDIFVINRSDEYLNEYISPVKVGVAKFSSWKCSIFVATKSFNSVV